MELLLEQLPELLRRPIRASWGDQIKFRGTPLTLSAALGRTELVRLLLDAGCDPDERGRGDVSRFELEADNAMDNGIVVTPVLAAILFGQEETTRLLLDAGAHCDFSRSMHRKILYQGSAATLELASRLPNVGFETIPQEELETMRFTVSEGRERSVFWGKIAPNE